MPEMDDRRGIIMTGALMIVAGLVGTDEEVDLADWVRVFGDRLEGNFDLWYHAGTIEERAFSRAKPEAYKANEEYKKAEAKRNRAVAKLAKAKV